MRSGGRHGLRMAIWLFVSAGSWACQPSGPATYAPPPRLEPEPNPASESRRFERAFAYDGGRLFDAGRYPHPNGDAGGFDAGALDAGILDAARRADGGAGEGGADPDGAADAAAPDADGGDDADGGGGA